MHTVYIHASTRYRVHLKLHAEAIESYCVQFRFSRFYFVHSPLFCIDTLRRSTRNKHSKLCTSRNSAAGGLKEALYYGVDV